VITSSQPVGTLYRCTRNYKRCRDLTFQGVDKAMEHTMDTGHACVPMLEVREESE
jgi:hypothetical protein